MIDETAGADERGAVPENERTVTGECVAFCQQCGKGLTAATVRRAGSAVFCEPCLVARLEGQGPTAAGTGPSASTAGWTPVGSAAPGAGVPPPATPPVPPAAASNEPSPWLAAFLGLIPGVGAMYNGQYAKGVAHLVIFAVLDSLANNVNDIFALLVAGWVFYQIFDAYHTAKARRDGTPLPNPFGLNDIGDRMGFGRNWPGSAARPVTSATTAGWGTASAATAGATTTPPPPGSPNWSGYVPPTNFGANATPPPPASPPPAPEPTAYASAPSGSGWTQAPYTSTYTGEPWRSPAPMPGTPAVPVAAMPPARRFPVGAAWLIALGLVFLLANLNASWRLGGSWLVAITLAALGSWLLYRRIEYVLAWSRIAGETDPHAAEIGPRLMCQIRWPMMLLVLALLFALQAAGIRTLGQTWGVLLIVFGALLILERTLGRNSNWYPVAAPAGTAVPPTSGPRKDGQ